MISLVKEYGFAWSHAQRHMSAYFPMTSPKAFEAFNASNHDERAACSQSHVLEASRGCEGTKQDIISAFKTAQHTDWSSRIRQVKDLYKSSFEAA